MTVTASSVSFFLAGVPFFYYFQLSSSVYLHLPRRSVIKKGSKGRLSSWPTKPLSSGDPLLPLLCPCTVGLLPPLSLIIYVHPSVQPKTTTTTSTAAIAATTCHYSLREAILLVVPTILTALVAVRGLQPLAESIRVCESHVLRLAFEMFENAFLRSFHCIWLVHFFIFIFIFFFFLFSTFYFLRTSVKGIMDGKLGFVLFAVFLRFAPQSPFSTRLLESHPVLAYGAFMYETDALTCHKKR